MAIKIPSKNIYDINNPKIRDNVIDNVSVSQKVVMPSNEYETSVYNEKIENGWITESTISNVVQNQKNVSSGEMGNYFWTRSISYLSLIPTYLNVKLSVPRVKANEYISQIYHSYKTNEQKEKEPDIKVTIYADLYEGNATANGHYDFVQDDDGTGATITNIVPTYPSSATSFSGKLKPLLSYTYDGAELDTTASLNYTLQETIMTPNFDNTSDNDNYIIEFKCLVGYEQLSLGGEKSGVFVGAGSNTGNEGDMTISGRAVKYITKQVEITLYGDTLGIDLTDGSITCGSGSKPYSLSGNELLQDNGKKIDNKARIKINNTVPITDTFIKYYFEVLEGTVEDNKYAYWKERPSGLRVNNDTTGQYFFTTKDAFVVGDELEVWQGQMISQFLGNNILTQYKTGKETATLLCDINEYYDEEGNLVISIKDNDLPMTFKIGDKVIPMIFGANGKDMPMSKTKDGKAKTFVVVGKKPLYDGAVWQEIYLQEL